MKRSRCLIACAIFVSTLCYPRASAQTKTTVRCDPRLGLADMVPIGYTKGRWQDALDAEGERDPVRQGEVRKILQFGTKAVPLLIACLTDEEKTETPIWDYWPETRMGDIAFAILCDLFSDPTGRSTLINPINWSDVDAQFPGQPASIAWNRYLAKYGRAYVQQNWLRAWTENKSRIYWDNSIHCFRVRSGAAR